MRKLKQFILKLVGMSNPSDPTVLRYQAWRRRVLKIDAKMSQAYLQSHSSPKLHLGASNHTLEGWLNTDIFPHENVMFMDATKTYPFPDQSFDLVYSEHMIEHVPYEAGQFMLKECYRVLRPGGLIRIVTPDLATIMALYADDLSPKQREYIAYMSQRFIPEAPEMSQTFVINAFFRMWGHQFIFDEKRLVSCLKTAGFSDIQRRRLGDSSNPALSNLENVQRYPDGMLDFESLCLEATKK